jgi:hypothetical protein
MVSQISMIDSSNTPCVDGYVTIKQESWSLYCSAFALRSATSIFPSSSDFTITTSIAAITALAGFVPCADAGINETVLCKSPRLA